MTVKLKRLHDLQKQVSNCKARYIVLSNGRRWGKTTFIIHEIVLALLRGERVGLLLPAFRFFNSIWDELLLIFPPELIVVNNKNDKIIQLITGGRLKIHSAEFSDSLRGEKHHLMAVDEAAAIPNLEHIWEAVIEPTLIDYQGRCIFASTPRGKNFFYHLAQRALNDSDYAHFTAPTYSNPHLPEKERNRLKNLPSTPMVKQEIHAEFLDDGGEVFSQLLFTDDDYEPVLPYRIGVDLARSEDFTVISIFDANNVQIKLERFQLLDWNATTRRIKTVLEPYKGISEVIVDRTGVGAAIVDRLIEEGVDCEGFIFTDTSRTRIVENLSLLIAEQSVKFLDIPEQTSEFEGFMRRVVNGKIKLEASTAHDDCVMAASMALSKQGFEIIVA